MGHTKQLFIVASGPEQRQNLWWVGRVTCAGRADQQNTGRGPRPQIRELLGIPQELDQLQDFFLDLVNAGNVLKGDLRGLATDQLQLCPAKQPVGNRLTLTNPTPKLAVAGTAPLILQQTPRRVVTFDSWHPICKYCLHVSRTMHSSSSFHTFAVA